MGCSCSCFDRGLVGRVKPTHDAFWAALSSRIVTHYGVVKASYRQALCTGGPHAEPDFDKDGNFVMSMMIRLIVDGSPETAESARDAVCDDIKISAMELGLVAEPHVKLQRSDLKHRTWWFILVYVRFPPRMFKY